MGNYTVFRVVLAIFKVNSKNDHFRKFSDFIRFNRFYGILGAIMCRKWKSINCYKSLISWAISLDFISNSIKNRKIHGILQAYLRFLSNPKGLPLICNKNRFYRLFVWPFLIKSYKINKFSATKVYPLDLPIFYHFSLFYYNFPILYYGGQ